MTLINAKRGTDLFILSHTFKLVNWYRRLTMPHLQNFENWWFSIPGVLQLEERSTVISAQQCNRSNNIAQSRQYSQRLARISLTQIYS